jgi:chitin disaccharide deacetylase
MTPSVSTLRRDDKLLIIHADDFGMCHSVNRAIICAFEQNAIGSASAMVPCAWFMEAAEYARRNPRRDIGVHVTLTSEWILYKWGPVSRFLKKSGLTDDCGYFWPSTELIAAGPEEVSIEISSQVTSAICAGIVPSHLDSHMFSLLSPRYIATYVESAKRFRVPCLVDSYWHSYAMHKEVAGTDDVVVDMVIQAEEPNLTRASMEEFYLQAIQDLRPGLNQLIVHPGYDDAELRGITGEQKAFGASWRQHDLDILTGSRFKRSLEENGVVVTDWRSVYTSLTNSASCSEQHES